MKYVLLLVFMHGNGSYPLTVMHDFDSKESCVAALREVRSTYAAQPTYMKEALLKSICIPK